MAEGLVHVHEHLDPIQEHWRVLVGHQESEERVAGHLSVLNVVVVGFVLGDELASSGRVEEREEDLIETGIALLFVEKVDQTILG